jgi:thiol-disulfide isomerase/thioredoxin
MIARSLMLFLLALSWLATGGSAAGELSPVTATTPLVLHLPDLEGQVQALDALRGKLVLVNFWASWCTPCVTEMPSIQRLADDMRDLPFTVIGVNVGEGELRVRAMVERLGLDFPILLDKDSAAFERLRISVLPTTYLLDGDGIVRYVGRGPFEWDSAEVKDILRDLAAAAAAPLSQQ